MGLTEHHWFEDEEEARRWLEEGKEKKMVVYDAIVKGSNYGTYEDYDHFTRALGLYKTRESAVKAIMNINQLFDGEELRPLEDDISLPADCIRGATNRRPIEQLKKDYGIFSEDVESDRDYYFDGDWDYFFYIEEREVLD